MDPITPVLSKDDKQASGGWTPPQDISYAWKPPADIESLEGMAAPPRTQPVKQTGKTRGVFTPVEWDDANQQWKPKQQVQTPHYRIPYGGETLHDAQQNEIWQARRKAASEEKWGTSLPAVVREPFMGAAATGANLMSAATRPFSKEIGDYFAKQGEIIAMQSESGRKDDWFPWASRMLGGAVQSATQAGIMSPLGTYGMAAGFGATEYNQALYDAEQAGVTGKDRIRYAAVQGAIEGSIMSVFNMIGMPGLEGLVGQVGAGTMKNIGKQFLAATYQELPEELLTEAAHAVAEAASGVDPTAMDRDQYVQRMIDTVGQTILTVGLTAGAGRLTQNKEMIQELENIKAKGFVSEEDATKAGLTPEESKSRKTRRKAVQDRIDELNRQNEQLEQELQNNEVRKDVQPQGEETAGPEVRPGSDVQDETGQQVQPQDVTEPPAEPTPVPEPQAEGVADRLEGLAQEPPAEDEKRTLSAFEEPAQTTTEPVQATETPESQQDTPEPDPSRVERIWKDKGWKKTGSREADTRREESARKRAMEEEELVRQYPPGTRMTLEGYRGQEFMVNEDGTMSEVTSRRPFGEAGKTLWDYTNAGRKITVVPSAEQQAEPEPPTVPQDAPQTPPVTQETQNPPLVPETQQGADSEAGQADTQAPMIGTGDVLTTSSGRQTTPAPKIDTTSERKATNTVKRVNQWLIDNAVAEAEARGDDYNATIFKGETAGNLPQASKDAMNEYLFGTQPPVAHRATKRFGRKDQAEAVQDRTLSASETPKIGDNLRISNVESTLADTQEIGGVRYELFNDASIKGNGGAIRTVDTDSGNVVEIRRFPTYDAAEQYHKKSLYAADPERTAQPKAKIAKPKKKPKKSSVPQTLAQAVRSLGGLNIQQLRQGERVNIEEDIYQSGLRGVLRRQGNKRGKLDLEQMAEELESQGWWKAPEGSNKGDALLQALKDGELTIESMERQIEREYEEYHAKLDQEAQNAKEEGETQDSIEESVRSGLRDGAQASLKEAGATEEETREILDDLDGDTSFNFGANVKPKQVGIEGEQMALFQKEEQGSLFNVSQGKRKSSAPQKAGPSELERLTDEQRASKVESLPGQQGLSQELKELAEQARREADQAWKDAEDALDDFGDDIRDSLFSDPFANPRLVANAGKVIYKYAKAGIKEFNAFVKQLAADLSQAEVDWILPVLRSKWDEIHATGEIEGMQPIVPDQAPPSTPEGPDNVRFGGTPETTSIKNAAVTELREARGEEPIPRPQPQSFPEWVDEAQRRYNASGGQVGRSLVATLLNPKTRRAVNEIDHAILQVYYRDVNNKFGKAAEALTEAASGNDPIATATAQSDADLLLKELVDIENASDMSGTIAGRALVARRIELEKDFSLGAMVARAQVANGGKPFTAEQMQEFVDLSKLYEAAQKQVELLTRRNEELERNQRVDSFIEDAKKVSRPRKTQGKKDKLKQKAATAVANFKEQWSTLFQIGIVPDPKADAEKWAKITAAAGDVVKAYAELGVYTFGQFFSNVKQQFGKGVEDAEQAFREAWDKAKAAGQIPVPKMSMENVLAVSRVAKQIARDVVEGGVTERDKVVDIVHESLQEIIPEITRRETMDAISGYGQFTPLSQEDVDVTLRDIKGQLQQLSKLDDMDQGRAPAKTGMQRRDPSDEERRLIKLVNDRMKREGHLVADPDTQLRTALEAAKTTARNSISDMRYEMEQGEKIVRDRTKLVPDEELKQLREERDIVREAYKQMFPEPGPTAESQIQQAERQIERIQQELKDIQEGRENHDNKTPDLLPEQKRQELESWRKKLKDAKKRAKEQAIEYWETEGGATKPSPEIAATRKALDRIISVLEQQLARGDVEYKGKKVPISTPAIERKRDRIAELRALRDAMRLEKGLTEERSRKLYLANLHRRKAEYEQRIAEGDFAPKPKKAPRKMDRELVNAKKELDDVKQDYYRRVADYKIANLHGVDKLKDVIYETGHLSRAVMTAFDLSAVLRQGGITSFSHPVLAKRASSEMFAALVSEDAEFASHEKIREHELFQFAITSGLSIAEREGTITRQEEAFMGRWVNHLSKKDMKGVAAPLVAAAKGTAASARAYTTMMNSLRYGLFTNMVENLGRDGRVTEAEAQVIAKYINISTGRADVGAAMKWINGMNVLFFAPRYVASRFQYLAMPFTPTFHRSSGRVKKALAAEYARHVTGMALFYGTALTLLSMALGDEDDEPTVELDPRSSDFLKIRIGDTRIDPTAGLSQAAVFLSRLATGETKTQSGEIRPLRKNYTLTQLMGGEQQEQRPIDSTIPGVIGRFFWSKTAPVPGGAVNILAGENVVGEEVTPAGAVRDMFIPLSFREVRDTLVARGVPMGAAISVLNLFGMGTANYGPRTKYATGTPEERQKQFDNDILRLDWDSPDPAYMDLLDTEQQAQVATRRVERQSDAIFAGTSEKPEQWQYQSVESYQEGLDRHAKEADIVRSMKETTDFRTAVQLLTRHYQDEAVQYASQQIQKNYGASPEQAMRLVPLVYAPEDLMGQYEVARDGSGRRTGELKEGYVLRVIRLAQLYGNQPQ